MTVYFLKLDNDYQTITAVFTTGSSAGNRG